jgi:hypothetical protein
VTGGPRRYDWVFVVARAPCNQRLQRHFADADHVFATRRFGGLVALDGRVVVEEDNFEVLLLKVLLSSRVEGDLVGVGVLELGVDSICVLGVTLVERIELVVEERLHIRHLRILKAQVVSSNH